MPPPLIVAHRGASADAPENTLPAFRLAWERGADAIEGDFRLTRDGRIVCIHDASTERTGDRMLFVAAADLATLRTVDVGVRQGRAFSGAKIPVLSEVLDTVPEHGLVYIELKDGPEIVSVLVRELAAHGFPRDRLRIIAFDPEGIRRAKRLLPDTPATWLVKLEPNGRGTDPSAGSVLATLRDIGADGVGTGRKNVHADFIRRIRKAGFEHHVWTVDSIREAKSFHQAGAASITTNVPARMREAFPRP